MRDQRHHRDERAPRIGAAAFSQAKDQSGNAEGAEDAENFFGVRLLPGRRYVSVQFCCSSALSASSAFQTPPDEEPVRNSVCHRWGGKVRLALEIALDRVRHTLLSGAAYFARLTKHEVCYP